MEIIRKAEKREYLITLLVSATMLLAGVILCVTFFSNSYLWAGIGAIMSIINVVILSDRLPAYYYEEFPVSMMMALRPKEIVWVYTVITRRMPFGFQVNQTGMMYFKCLNKKEFSVALPATELKRISERLNDLLPHATFGYSDEKEQLYLAHPAMLLKK